MIALVLLQLKNNMQSAGVSFLQFWQSCGRQLFFLNSCMVKGLTQSLLSGFSLLLYFVPCSLVWERMWPLGSRTATSCSRHDFCFISSASWEMAKKGVLQHGEQQRNVRNEYTLKDSERYRYTLHRDDNLWPVQMLYVKKHKLFFPYILLNLCYIGKCI
jgi:hypothetical protein